MSFELVEPPRLSRATVSREEPLRLDAERLASSWPKARVLVVDEKARTPIRQGADGSFQIVTKSGTDVAAEPPAGACLLGEQDGVAYWAVRGAPSLIDGDDPSEWQDLRTRGGDLDATGAGLMVTAVAVLGWHDNAQFCARCGSTTSSTHAGWMRVCDKCAHEEYPRTDPAIICLVHDGGSGDAAKVLLARQPVWPPGRYSVLAGFVEAGESLEACVAREIGEEVGVDVTDVRYLGSQAWPFPRSLMIGFSAVADAAQPLVPADGEIAEAFWVTRAELRGALTEGDWTTQGGQQLLMPPSVSIARSMLESWAAHTS
ncbi:NAD(+) diphosphatase [Pseudonocardia spinosispora]|uniref:NAD(+) diphosphatase n=1 Tax=Pseudonocardia spinosispora TaxID=103441 RepID=UPI0004193BA6|nr:NAD(+) diphosphatase [Pseudonocardia spinosispora]